MADKNKIYLKNGWRLALPSENQKKLSGVHDLGHI
jgi:nitrogen fixation protein